MRNNFAVATGRMLAGRSQWLVLALLLLSGALTSTFAAAPYDDFANAKLLLDTKGSQPGNSSGATSEVGEPAHVVATATDSVWFRWIAPSSGSVVFTTDNSTTVFDTVLAVYTGNSVSNLILLASNDNSPTANGGSKSYVQFVATAGTTYRIALASKSGAAGGNYLLQWSMGGYAGTFGFTALVYEATDIETNSVAGIGPNGNVNNMVPCNIPGARITFTRKDGFNGRVRLHYSIQDNSGAGGVFGTDFTMPSIYNTTPVLDPTRTSIYGGAVYTNTVIFDDWQTSASILVQPAPSSTSIRQATFMIDSVERMPGESTAILAPQVESSRNTTFLETYTTRILANVQKVRWQVNESQTNATVRVHRGAGIANGGITRWRLDGGLSGSPVFYRNNGNISKSSPAMNLFPLAAGSDYATPGEDFTNVAGTLTWGAGVNDIDVDIPLTDDSKVEFNEDFRFDLYVNSGETITYGSGDHAYVTIVIDDRVTEEQASGAVDASYNRDYYNLTTPPYNATPGANDQVQAVAVDSVDRAIVGGDFTSINANPAYVRLARLNFDGSIDTSFTVGAGPNSSVLSILPSGSQTYIAGKFSSYNSQQRKGVARLNSDGTLDGSFNPGNGVSDPLSTPIRDLDLYASGTYSGKLVVVGDFTTFAGQAWSHIARLNSDGTADTLQFTPVAGANGPIYAVKTLSGTYDGYILIAGDFTAYDGVARNRVARLRPDGTLDTTFNPGSGANGAVYSMAVQSDGSIVLGGAFTSFDLRTAFRVARILQNGQLDTTFDTGYAADDTVYTVKLDSSQRILLGGLFRSFNQVRRAGYARLLSSGYLDTEFMDTAYNHYAGLHMRFSPLAEPKPYVRSLALQSDGDVIIGGSFQRIGGGARNTIAEVTSPSVTLASPWRNGLDQPTITPIWQNRDDIRNRSNFARVKGGSTPGPGNIGFTSSTYSIDEAAGQLFVTISRDNTDATFGLGQAFAKFTTIDLVQGPGSAASGSDYAAQSSTPTWSTKYDSARMVSQAATGANNVVGGNSLQYIPIVNDGSIEGNESFQVNLSAPQSGLLLGGRYKINDGEVIPVGIALGRSTATVTIIDDDFEPTYISFSKARYTVTENGGSATIDVIRTGSTTRSVSVDYLTTEHLGTIDGDIEETASQGADFTGAFGRLTFGPGQTNLSFTVPITDDTAAEQDESINLYLSNLSPGVSFGTSSQTFLPADVNTGGSLITLNGHGFYNTTEVKFSVSTGGALPGGLTAGTSYFVVVPDGNHFQVSLTPGGTPVTLTTTGAGTFTVEAVQNLARLTIFDNDYSEGSVRFSTTTKYSATEGNSVTVTLQRTGGNLGAIQVGYTTVDGTATQGSDYTYTTNNLIWNNLDTTPKSFTIPINTDGAVEGTETFYVNLAYARRLSDGAAVTMAGVNPIPVDIIDADHYGTLKFASANFSVSENGGKAIITVVRTGGSSGAVHADVNVTDGTATTPTYYTVTATPYLVDMVAGQTSTNFTINIVDNTVQQGNKSFNLQMDGFLNAENAATELSTVTIVDDETYNQPAGSVDTGYNALAGPNDFIHTLALQSDEKLLVGGDFTQINGITQTRLARLDKDGVLDASFNVGSGTDGSIRSIVLQDDGRVLIGGLFTNYNGTTRNHIARLNQNGTIDLTFDPGTGADNPINAIAVHHDSVYYGKIVVAGAFSTIGSFNRPYVARLNTNGVVDTTFDVGSGPNAPVYALAIQSDGKVLIGGAFTNVNQNTSYPYLARLNTNGTLDTSFKVDLNKLDGSVRAIALQSDGKIVVGGFFQNAGAFARKYVARLNSDGTVDTGFDPLDGGDSAVFAIALQPDGKILLGGDFQTFSGVTRRRLTRLNQDGSADVNINFGGGANNFISSIVIQPSDGKIIAGGGFTQFSGYARNYLVRLYGGVLGGSGSIEMASPLYQVSEASTNAVMTVRRNGGTEGTVQVNYAVTTDPTHSDTATIDVDYQSSSGVLTFPPGETEQVLQIPIIPDTLPEDPETFSVNLTSVPVGPTYAPLSNQPFATVEIDDNDSEINFGSVSMSVLEGDPSGILLVPLVRVKGTDGTVTVQLVSSNGTAFAGTNYVALNQQVTFNPGDTVRYVPLSIIDNKIGEPDKTLTLNLINPQGDGLVGSAGTATVTIIDDDFTPGVVQFENAAVTVDENIGFAQLKLIRTGGSSGLITVDYATVQLGVGQATGGTTTNSPNDYVSTNGSVTFADGETTKTIRIQIVSDANTTETNEAFQVLLSDPYRAGASLGFPNPATVTIQNNNSIIYGNLHFSRATYAATEDEGTATVEVALLGQTAANANDIYVTFRTSDGTATAGSDYTNTVVTMMFTNAASGGALDWTNTVQVPIIKNSNVVEPVETVLLSLDTILPVGGPGIGLTNATLYITNTTTLPGTLAFTQQSYSTNENSGALFLTVARTNGLTGPVSVDVKVTGGSALGYTSGSTVGYDYTNFVTTNLTWADGDATTKLVRIDLIDDSIVEADETINLSLANIAGGAVYATNAGVALTNATAIIVDDETKAGSLDTSFTPTLDGAVLALHVQPSNSRLTIAGEFQKVNLIGRTNIAQLNSDGTLLTSFNAGLVTLGTNLGSIYTVAVYTNGTNIGKVIIGGRFDAVNGTTRSNIARLNVDGTVDTTFNPGSGPNLAVNAITLQPDGLILIGGAFSQYQGTTRNFIARLQAGGALDSSFDPGAGANGPVNAVVLQGSGSVIVGGDFTIMNGVSSSRIARLSSSGVVDTTFAANVGTGFDDSVFALAVQGEDNKILVGGAFTLANTNSFKRLARLNADGTVDSLTFTNLGVGFNDSVFSIVTDNKKILVAGNFTDFKGVPFNRIIRLAGDGGLDTTINFGQGADGFISSMALQPDGKIVIGGGFSHFNGTLQSYLARLNNGTNSGSGVLEFTSNKFQVYEDGGSVTLGVRRLLGTTNALSVGIAFTDGTAYAGTNYIIPAVTNLTFAEGETFKTLVVAIPDNPDGVVTNAVRSFTANLVNATNLVDSSSTNLLTASSQTTVDIIDNETVISFSSPSYVVAENGSTAVITVLRTGGSNDAVSVNFDTVLGTATPGADYTTVSSSVAWAANDIQPKTVNIQILPDTLVEGTEYVNLQLSGYAGSVLPGLTNAVLSILDDDFSPGVIGFASTGYNVTEGQAAQVSLVRSGGSAGIVSATLTVSNITALAGSDYVSTNILVTFANGEVSKTVNIATIDDAVQDDGETFLAHLSAPTGGATLGLADTTITIDDNDVTIGFTTNAVSVAESDTTLFFDVTRSGLLNRTFVVDYTTTNGTAQAGLDYVPTNGVIVFGPGVLTQTIAVTVKDDFIIEGPETFAVKLSGTNLTLLGNTQSTVTIQDNDVSTDLEVLVNVNNPVKTNQVVQYTLIVTNYGPSDISGVTLTNVLPASLQLQSVSTTNYTTNGNTLIFDLPLLAKASGFAVQVNALDTNGVIRSVTNVATIGLLASTNDNNLANNVVTNVTKLRGPEPYLAVESLTITSEVPGPANGAFDINEQATVNVTFRNTGEQATTAAVATLQGTGGVTTNTGPQTASLGAIAPNGTVSKSFTFLATGTNNGNLTLTFALTDGATTYDPAVLRYRLGGNVLNAETNAITINDYPALSTPYPSILNISGVIGIVDQVSLTLSNVTHAYPDDLDILLVSPSGQAVLVMSDVGNDRSLNNVTFTISDLASVDLPDSGQILNGGSYRPHDYTTPTVGDDTFASPAPSAPYFTSMAAYKGIDPNGQWKLYVRDDTVGDAGVISNGWSLNITTVYPANPTAGLVLAGTQTQGPIAVGADQLYTLIVTNHGPSTATNVFLTNTFSAAYTFVSASNTVAGAFTQPAGRVVLALGNMTNGAIVTNYVTVKPTTAGTFTNLASVVLTSSETDPFLGDNSLVFSQIVGASSDLAVGVTTSPISPVFLGNNLTYNISLTNFGPSTATSVVLTNLLPAGVNYVSSTASQGVVSRSGSLVTASLGSLASNGVAQVSIVVTPTSAGSLTNTTTAASSVTDPVTANNTAIATTTVVTDSADLQLSLTGAPDPVTQGNNITYTITVTNKGPSTALGVVVTNPLPGSVTLVSTTNSQGTVTNTAGSVVFNLGSLPTNTNAVMKIVVTANTAGAVNDTAIVASSGTFDAVSANNSATIVTAVQSPAVDIDIGPSSLVSESLTPANGAIDPGETVTVSLGLVNKGGTSTGNLVATLLPTGGVSTNSGPQVQTYGAVASGTTVSRNFTFTANGNLGDTLSVTLQLADGASNLGTVTFAYQLGATAQGASSTVIATIDGGAAATYPSVINISGVSGTILKATVTLSNVTHTFPDDLDILLVSPTGAKVLLMSDAGGGFAINSVDITLDDNASQVLPDSGQITNGVYRPSNYLNSPIDATSTNDVFASPAPAGPYSTALTNLVGTNPNGDWKLYVMDDQVGNSGSIGGWKLSLVTVATVSPSADLALTVTSAPEPVTVRSNLVYTLTLTNAGPNTVSGVTVSNVLSTNVTLVGMSTAKGTIATNASGAVVWTLGSVTANAQHQATITVTPEVPGSITNVAVARQTDIELNSANNTATTVSTVSGLVLSGGSVTVNSGNVSLTLLGQPNITYVIEASTNLVDWFPVYTNSSPDGVIVINDPSATGAGLRFYRAR